MCADLFFMSGTWVFNSLSIFKFNLGSQIQTLLVHTHIAHVYFCSEQLMFFFCFLSLQ